MCNIKCNGMVTLLINSLPNGIKAEIIGLMSNYAHGSGPHVRML